MVDTALTAGAATQPALWRKRRAQYWSIGIIVLTALALRLLVLGYIAHEPRKFYTYDSDGYDRRALNLLRYGQFSGSDELPLKPDANRTPVYPLMLAAIFGTVGREPWAVALVQGVLGALTAVLAYLLALELGLSRRAGLIAGLIVALDPVSIMNSNRMLTETLFTTLLVTGVWLLVRYWNTTTVRWALGAAVVFALAALTRPISQFLPIALLPLFVVLLRKIGWRRTLGGALLFAVISMGLTYSWAYRNYHVTGMFTLSTISDINLIYYRARAVLADVEHTSQDEAWAKLQTKIDEQVAAQGLGPADKAALERQEALKVLLGHPMLTAKMFVEGVGRMLFDPGYTITCTLLDRTSTSFECFPGKSSMNEPGVLGKALGKIGMMTPVQVMMLGWSVLLLAVVYLSSLAGGVQLVRERRWLVLALLALLIAYFVGLAAGAESNSRFRVPVMPFLAIFAGVGLGHIGTWILRRRRS